jgi:hypothetical protein
MSVEVKDVKGLVTPVYYASRDVITAVRTLILRTEELEEKVLREKLPETEMSEAELRELDNSLREMQKEGAAITLEDFNKHQGLNEEHSAKVQSERS